LSNAVGTGDPKLMLQESSMFVIEALKDNDGLKGKNVQKSSIKTVAKDRKIICFN